ncbi:MAG: heavy metal-associated domain-containing protein [Vicingaceae bacterium]|nr:heavy metal-associated domain-containing protein [Vicingaceae bacterium]
MKNIITIMLITLTSLFTTNVKAQKSNETAEIKIKTSAQCEMCKQRLEKAMAYEKGIKSSKLDVESATLTVVFKPNKTTPDKIRTSISKTGYDADKIKAEEKAYNNLPDCCKKGGMEH